MAEEFKISLGLEISPDAKNSIKTQIDSIQTEPIQLNIDTKSARSKLDTIKRKIDELSKKKIDLNVNNTGSRSGSKNSLPIVADVPKITQAFEKLTGSIDKIKISLGTLDDGSEMKSLLASINEISKALSGVSTQFAELSSAIKGMNFNVNFGLGNSNNPIAASAAYGSKVRKETLPQLREQANALEEYVRKYYGVADGLQAVFTLLGKADSIAGNFKLTRSLQDVYGELENPESSMKKRMEAYESYINLMKKAANMTGLDLNSVTSGFSKSADELVQDAEKILTGESDVENATERLKSIFGSTDLSGVTAQLTEIINKLDQLNTSIKEVSSNISIEGISASFEGLSSSIQQIVQNCSNMRTSLENGVASAGNSVARVASSINGINLSATAEQIEHMETAMKSFGFDDAAINAVTQNLNEMGLTITKITTQLENDDNHTVAITVQGVDELGRTVTAIRRIRDEFEKDDNGELVKLPPNVREGRTTISQSFAEDDAEIRKTKYAYDELIKTIKEMGSIKKTISGLDSVKDAEQIEVLSAQLDKLQVKYEGIRQSFDDKFDKTQIAGITEELQRVSNAIDVINSKMADKSQSEFAKKFDKAFDINEKLQIGDFDKDSSDIETSFAKITNKSEAANSAVEEFRNSLVSLKSAISSGDIDGIIDAFDKYQGAFKKAKNQISINTKTDDAEVKEVKKVFNELSKEMAKFIGLQKQISNMKLKIGGLEAAGGNDNQISVLKRQLEDLENTYSRLMGTFMEKLSVSDISMGDVAEFDDEIAEAVANADRKLKELQAKVADTRAKLANNISLKFDDGTFDNDVDKVNASLSKIKTQSAEVVSSMQEFNTAFANLQTAKNKGDIDAIIEAYEEYVKALRKVKNQIDINTRAEKQSDDAEKMAAKQRKFELDKQAFSSGMDIWLHTNSAAAKQFGNAIDEIKRKLVSCDATEFEGLKSEFKEIIRQAELTGKTTQSFGDKLKKKFSDYGTYFSVASMINYAEQALRSMYNNVVEVDTAMTGLYRVTDLTTTQYSVLYDNMVISAKEYGSTLTEIINSTADWVRLGFDENEAVKLSEITAMYQHISDLDYNIAVENLVTAYKGFQDQLLSLYDGDSVAAIEYIADIFNELDNNFAVTADDIGSALSKSASALNLAGNTIQETAAMVTGITEVTQDPEKAGNALKVLSLRLRGMKGELEELGEEIDENVDSISRMQTQILNLTGGKVNIFNDDGSFKSTFEMMDKIVEVYDTLDPTKQADLLETIAGKNRANDIAALISNWNQVEEALKSAMEAEGSAAIENAKHVESVQGHLNELKTSWQALSNTFIKTDILKGLIDGLTIVVNTLDKIIDTLGGFGAIGAGVSIFGISKGFFSAFSNNLKNIQKELENGVLSFENYQSAVKGAFGSLKGFMSTPAGIATAIGLVTTAISTAISIYNNLKQKERERLQSELDSANASLENADAFEEAYIKINQFANKASLTASEEEELAAAIGIANEALGDNAIAFDAATGSAKAYLEKLREITEEELKQNKSDATKARQAAEDLLKDSVWDLFGNTIDVYLHNSKTKMSEELSSAKDIVSELMPDYIDTDVKHYGRGSAVTEYSLTPSDLEDMDAVVDYYYQLDKLVDELALKNLTHNDIYKNASSVVASLKDNVEAYVKAKYQELKAEYQLKNGAPTTIEEYNAMRDAIIGNINASEEYKNTIGSMLDIDYGKLFETPAIEKSSLTISDKIATIKKAFAESEVSSAPNAIKQMQEFDSWLKGLNEKDTDIVYTIALSTDTAEWALQDWQNALEEAQFSFEDLMAEEDSDDAKSFKTQVDEYVEQVNTLKEALDSINAGEFTTADRYELEGLFPQLVGSDDLSADIQSLINDFTGLGKVVDENGNVVQEATGIMAVFEDAFGRIDSEEDRRQLAAFMKTVLELGQVVGNTQFAIDISAETEGMDKFFSAVKESVSATGLSSESIEELKARYQDLENYDPAKLFERTENGIHLNTNALRDLESAYEKQTKLKVDKQLDNLVKQYNELTDQIDETSDAAKRAELYARRKDILDQINDVANLASQYDGLTSAFQRWIQAQSMGEEGDMYDSLASGLAGIKELYDEGLIGTNKFRAAVQLMTNEDVSTKSAYELMKIYEDGYPKMQRYFTDSSDGCLNFLNDVQALNSEWVSMNDDGSWDIKFGVGGDQEVANALGINVELVQNILRKLSDYGFDINLDSMNSSLDLMKSEAEKAVEGVNKALEGIGKDPVSFNFNTTDIGNVESQIKEAQTVYDTLVKNSDGTINLKAKGAEEAKQILITLIAQKQELNSPSIMSVNTSQAKSDIEEVIGLLQSYQTTYNNLEINTAVGADTSQLTTDIQGKITEIEGLSPEIKASLGLDSAEFNAAIETLEANIQAGIELDQTALGTINTTIAAITPTMMVAAGLDASLIEGYEAPEKESEVKYTVNSSAVDSWQAPSKEGEVTYRAKFEEITPPTLYGTIVYTPSTEGGVGVDGTAHVNGTAFAHGTVGKAFKQGDWGTKGSGVALGGELGQEIVVRDGRFFTIGDNGAEFFNYKKGDIIFNHKQTEELFKNGKVTSSNGRGKALANGTAFAEGNAFSSGSGTIYVSGQVVTTASGSSGSGSGSDDEEEFKETFDWIEMAIDRIERAIDNLDLKASSTYRSWSERNANLKDEISEITGEIGIQQKAYERYLEQANSVGLSEEWAELVRNGAIDISTITDEELAEKINEYQEWYEKALDCKYAIDELKESQSELYEQAFDNIVVQYEGILSAIEYEKDMLDEYIAQSEAKGYITSTSYYEALAKAEQSNIEQLEKEKDALYDSMQEAVKSGAIAEGSEAWNEMRDQINEVNLAIAEANTSLIEYNNSIREIEWQVFDLLQEKISQIAQEGDFLIDLLSNDKLYDDKGQLTNEGMSTIGLHGMNYNVYMERASKYAQELLNIEKDITNDPYNQTLIERKQELLELQQESILAAEGEKQSIIEMVEEGINLELEALQELIDSYSEALDSQKDLYDYQKKVKEQTEEIAALEKQMAAYSGDTSEESRAKIQEIKVSLEEAKDNLEETEYDRYISDQKKLLDELYTEYETILNMRLDNVDTLISDVITAINDNASIINTTLSNKSNSVGYSPSETMDSIWNGSSGSDVVTTYGSGAADTSTTIGDAVNSFTDGVQNMTDAIDSQANTNINYTNNSSGSNANYQSSYTSASASASTSNSNNKSSSTNKSGSKSSANNKSTSSSSKNNNVFDYKKDSYPKDQLDVNKSVVDRLKYNNFDSSFSARSDYYNELGFSGTYTGSEEQNIKMLDYLKKNGYKQGKYRLSRNELAWTQEGRGLEAIIRPSDGAILTPLVKDDSILKASATSNMFNFFNDPSKFIRDNLNITGAISDNPSQNIVGNTYDNDFSIQIELPNVTNYEQFKYAMQHDKSFEKMVRSMTVDKMFGGSSLKKYKY